MKNSKKEYLWAVLMVLPALILFSAFIYYPLIKSLLYSVTDWNGQNLNYSFVGGANFAEMFKDKDIVKALYNTLYFSVVISVISAVVQIYLAIQLTGRLKGTHFVRTLVYIPCVISGIIVAITWTHIFQYIGVINKIMGMLGTEALTRDWLGDAGIVKNVISFVHMWQWMGYGTVIYITGLRAIPADIYEAAEIDGVSKFAKFFKITLPLLMPAVTINFFLSITGTLKIFDAPFTMTNGGPMNASSTVTMAIFNTAFKYNRFGLSSAIGLVFFAFIAILSITQLVLTRRKEVEY